MPHDHHDHDHGHDHAPGALSPSGHPYRADQDGPLTRAQALEIAVRELMIEKGLVTADEIAAAIARMQARTPAMGAAVVARAWHQPLDEAKKGRELIAPVIEGLESLVADAIKAGELKPATNAALVTELVWMAWLSNYRRAAYDSWTIETLKGHLDKQIDVILSGQRAL